MLSQYECRNILHAFASGWLSYGNGSHNGDYGFNMVAASVVPEPGSLLLMGAGLMGFGFSRRRRG